MPEFELGKSPYERPELIILLRRQWCRRLAVFESFVLGQAGVKLRLQEGEEEVQEVDPQRVRDDVPTLGDDNAEKEGGEEGAGADPTVGGIGGRGIKVGLVLLSVGEG